MKNHILVLMVVVMIASGASSTDAQESWPQSSSSISGYGSSLLFASIVNLSYEHLFLVGERNHVGITGGWTVAFKHFERDVAVGPHLAFTFLGGGGSNHFEFKAGAALVYDIDLFSIIDNRSIIPVISLGFRRQAPDSNRFFRCGISTAGLGVGVGYVFGR